MLLLRTQSLKQTKNRYDSGKVVRFGMNKGQKRYVRWMRRSTCGVYAIEAIGTGTRMMPLERFFKFWWRNRRERIAWRPLYCVSSTPEKRHDLTFQAGIDLVGQRYVSLLELILVAIRTNLTSRPDSNYEDLSKTVRRRFFCSEFTTAALKRMKLIEEKSIVDGHVQPGDYGSDYGEYVVCLSVSSLSSQGYHFIKPTLENTNSLRTQVRNQQFLGKQLAVRGIGVLD